MDAEEQKQGIKRKLEPSVLDNFNKLTSGQQKIRIKSASLILKHILEQQDNEIEKELNYALGRIIRGLGSNKINARSGFFASLVAIINYNNDVNIEKILDLINKQLHKAGGNSKSENADIFMGQILCCGAILRSNLYERSTKEDKEKVLNLMINASNERIYLQLAAYTFLIDLFEKIDENEFETVIMPILKIAFKKDLKEYNLDSLYLLLKIEEKFPNVSRKKLLPYVINSKKVVCEQNIETLSIILTTLSGYSSLKHPIYSFINEKIPKEMLINLIENFDKILIKNNRNKFLAITKLLIKIVENNKELLPELLTENYIKQLLNNFKIKKDKEVKLECYKLFSKILENINECKTKTKLKLIKNLLFNKGCFIFEKITKSKLIQNIIITLNMDGVIKMEDIYKKVIENEEKKWFNLDKIYACRLLVKLLNHSSMIDNNQWKIDQLIYLINLFMKYNKNSNEFSKNIKETFFSALNLNLNKLNDLQIILKAIVYYLNYKKLDLFNDNMELMENWDKGIKMIEIIDKKKDLNENNNLLIVFNTLFLHMTLQLLNDSKLAIDSINELINCFNRIFNDNDNNDDEPFWIEVVVDLFLNLLSHNSHLLRNIINCVFPHLCPFINLNALQQILEVLDPKKEDLNSDDDDDDYDDSEEENEKDVDDNSDDNDEDNDDDDDDDENTNDKLKLALHQVLGQDSDQESIDLNNINEEDGENLDKALAEVFKQFRPNISNSNKKDKRSQEILTHFRIRVMDLIEIYINSLPSMENILELIIPLLQLLEYTVKNDNQIPLKDKVKGCLKKIYKLKHFSNIDNVDNNRIINLLNELLIEKGSKTTIIIQDIGEQISESIIFLINSYKLLNKNKENKEEEISNILTKSLEEFFYKRDSLIPYCLFKNLLQQNWYEILKLIGPLMKIVFDYDNVRPFRRNQALELLKIFYTNHRFINTLNDKELKKIQKILKKFFKNLLDFFNGSNIVIKGKFLYNLFNLILSIRLSPISYSDNDYWDKIALIIKEYKEKNTFSTDAKGAYNKLLNNLLIK